MVGLEDAKRIVLAKHPNEWIYQIAEYNDCYQFWLLPKGEVWCTTTFVVDTPIVDKETGTLNDSGSILDTIHDDNYTFYDYRHSNEHN